MAQQVYKVRVSFQDAALLRDLTSFGFTAVSTGSNVTLSPDDVQDAVNTFLNHGVTGTYNPISGYIADNVSRATNGVNIAFTDITAHLDGSPAGTATENRQITLGAGLEATNTSDKLSVCVGYRADYGLIHEHGPATSLPSTDDAIDQGAPPVHIGTPRPRARMRGRLYLGPFIFDCMDSATGEPLAAMLTSISSEAATFFGIHNEGLDNQWSVCVHSRRDAAVYATSGGFYYVNEGWATQTRRGDTTEQRVHTWVPVAT